MEGKWVSAVYICGFGLVAYLLVLQSLRAAVSAARAWRTKARVVVSVVVRRPQVRPHTPIPRYQVSPAV